MSGLGTLTTGGTSGTGSQATGIRARFGRRAAERRGAWQSTLAVALCLGIALSGLSPLLQGITWWFAAMAMIVAVLAVAAVLRDRGAPEITVVAVSAITWGALVIVFYAADSLWFVVPTLDTLRDIAGDLADARFAIAEQETPAIAEGAITQLLVMSVGLIAIITDELASGLRTPVLAGAGPLALLVVTPVIYRDDPDLVLYLLTGASFLLVVWCSSRIGRIPRGGRGGRNPGLALGVGAAALAVMVAVPAVTPGLTADSFASGSGDSFASVYSAGVDPTIQLGRDLRRSDPVLSLTYSTDAGEGLYLKMVNLGDFSTDIWQPERPYEAERYRSGPFGTPQGLAAEVPITQQSTTVSIAGLRSDWLPLPYPTEEVDDLLGNWLLTPDTFTVTNLSGDTRGQNYQVVGLDIQPTAQQLADAGGIVPDGLESFTELPPGLDPVVAQTAAAVTAGAATNYDQAVALQEYFRSDQFSYSLNAPDATAYEGGNAQMIPAFLAEKSGYCVHFAGAMAVMARTLGIPSRIAVGYAPGQSADSTSEGGRALYEVYTDQLHSWPELYFEGVGWLPFEPTPGLDITPPDYSLPDYAQSDAGNPDAAADTPQVEATDPAEQPDAVQDTVPVPTAQQAVLSQVRSWGTFLAVLGALAAVVLAPLAFRRWRRRRRIRELASTDLPATLAWIELEDTLDDHRVDRSAGDTLVDLSERLVADHLLPAEPLERLRRGVEWEQYARPGSADTATRSGIADDLIQLVAAIEAEATGRDRTLARLLPVSLLRRRHRSAAPSGSLVP
ncbi:transglutaminase family protein [Herbiconiux liukaitaii]|uniref:transglutaminase family protein n=1 Tax=Herbiconiux liukaitaii TaxID=3342799 RepID=UPI0035BADFE7